jgi:hypothetical protein
MTQEKWINVDVEKIIQQGKISLMLITVMYTQLWSCSLFVATSRKDETGVV